MTSENIPSRRWTEKETILALFLYFQLPFGKIDSGTPEIQKLASAIGRTSNSVAMKLGNFASLDPKITGSGRRGLTGASKQDRQLYAKFSADWTLLVTEAELLWSETVAHSSPTSKDEVRDVQSEYQFQKHFDASTSQAIVPRRIGQNFFRRAVIANFEEQCCITGLSEPRLLIASHIRPWHADEHNRHNPANGLLLSATFDRAFDCGLISADQNKCLHISRQLLEHTGERTRSFFEPFSGTRLRPAARLEPDPEFLDWHFTNVFIDNRAQNR
jgi:putative restriction endonuclease